MGTRLSATLEDTEGEIIKRPLVAEENHLAVDLATQVRTSGDLAHFGFADFFAADEDLTLTVGATDADTALTDAREHGIAVGVTNEMPAPARRKFSIAVSTSSAKAGCAAKVTIVNGERNKVLMRHFSLFHICCMAF